MEKNEAEQEKGRVGIQNVNVDRMDVDVLYHLALDSRTHDLKDMFGDVKFVCMGGTPRRMEAFARLVKKQLDIRLPAGADLYDIGQASYRYALYKIGPVIAVSHGMGIPSLSILMHEIIKLVHHAQCCDVTFLRLGTSGGIGIPAGRLVISDSTVDGLLRPYLELHILGESVQRPAILDQSLVNELLEVAARDLPQTQPIKGKTMCTLDFYEGQGRLDGAFCDFSSEDKQRHLRKIREAGVTNIEMESLAFAAMCHQANISGGVICVTLLDRLLGDQVTSDKATLESWQQLPQQLAIKFIQNRWSKQKQN